MRLSGIWSNPDFQGVDELESLLPRLETAAIREFSIDGVKQERLAVMGTKGNGIAYCYPTKRYKVVQNWEVIAPFAQALVDSGFENFQGSIREYDGRMLAQISINNPAYYPKVKGEAFAYIITLKNSYNSELAMSGELDAVKLACTNGMIGLFPQFSWEAIHVMTMEEAVGKWSGFLDRILDAPSSLGPIIEKAKSQVIKVKDVKKLLYGAGFGQRHTNKILDGIVTPSLEIDGWQVYNAANGMYSHDDDGAEKLDTQRDNIKRCNKILMGNWSEMTAEGEKIAQAIEDAEKERKAKKNLKS